MTIYKRFENESDEELIYRICSDHDAIGTWQQVADIINKLLGTDFGESTYRKKYAAFQKMFEANRSKLVDNDGRLADVLEEERRLEREKIRYRDERHAWNKQNYLAARVEDKLDMLEDALSDIGRREYKPVASNMVSYSASSMVIMLSDLHIGATFNSPWGHYDTDVAEDRMWQLLGEVIRIQKKHACEDCYVIVNGDDISGSIHRSIQVTNREDVIDQVKIAAELISSFCYEVSKLFSKVNLIGVSGNHSRIDRKDESIASERLDRLVTWIVGILLQDVNNFEVLNDVNLDTSLAVFDIRGKEYVAVHGDYDPFSKSGTQNLITMIGSIPYAVMFGHLHTPAFDECNGIKMIRGGSLAGSGDAFTIEKRLCGRPSQMVFITNEDGIEALYPTYLD